METKILSVILIFTILGTSLGFGISYLTFNSLIQNMQNEFKTELDVLNSRLLQIQELANKTIHTITLRWTPSLIPSGSKLEGYVAEWTPEESVRLMGADVWAGNPYDVLWEGDIFLTLNNTANLWEPAKDEVIIHYQFDSHASSSLPHFHSYDLYNGFVIEAGQTVYVFRLFNNFDVKDTVAGDGWIRLYYIAS